MVKIDIIMPTYCYDCPCHNGENGRCNITGDYVFDKRPFDCPLREDKSTTDDEEVKHGGWISVKERLPEKDEDVLVYSGSDIAAAVYYKYKFNKRTGFDKTAAGGFYDDELELIDGVTHWMPLPEPPEVEG